MYINKHKTITVHNLEWYILKNSDKYLKHINNCSKSNQIFHIFYFKNIITM